MTMNVLAQSVIGVVAFSMSSPIGSSASRSIPSTSSPSTVFPWVLHKRHLQPIIQGAARSNNGLATRSKRPKPANMPTTWARCHMTEARECPNLFLHGPLS